MEENIVYISQKTEQKEKRNMKWKLWENKWIKLGRLKLFWTIGVPKGETREIQRKKVRRTENKFSKTYKQTFPDWEGLWNT